MAKRKISFDIEDEVFEKIKLIVKEKDIGQGEFLREIVDNALENYKSDNYITIYIVLETKIEKFTINKKEYRIDIFNPSKRMVEFVGAKKEGTIELLPRYNYDNNDSFYNTLRKNDNKLSFYIK